MIAKMNQIPSHLHQSWPHEALQTERREKFLHCDAFYKRKCPRVWLKITFKRWPHLAFFSLFSFSLLSSDSHLRFQSRTFLNYCTLSRAQAAPRSSRVGQLTPAPAAQPAVSPAVQSAVNHAATGQILQFKYWNEGGGLNKHTHLHMSPLSYSLALADMYFV